MRLSYLHMHNHHNALTTPLSFPRWPCCTSATLLYLNYNR